MNRITIRVAAVILPVFAAMTCAPALAQAKNGSIAGPDYGEDGNYRTPAADGRPGVYFFDLGVYAYKKGHYAHAIDMYKVSASWAYKPAEYNLGLMYFKGQGIPVDRARGTAWMILAAERSTPPYVQARDLMVTALTDAEFKRTDAIWNRLKPTYGDAVALKRAKAQWIRAGRAATGSHLGHAMGNLLVGTSGGSTLPSATKGSAGLTSVDGSELMGGGAQPGADAYRQFDKSDNPYSPIYLKHRTGTVTVKSLEPLESGAGGQAPGNAAATHKHSGATQPGDNKNGAPQPPPSSSSQGA